MPDRVALIGRGGFLLTLKDSSTETEFSLKLRYEIQLERIVFYPVSLQSKPENLPLLREINRDQAISLFELIQQITAQPTGIKTSEGYLTLASLPASPAAAFYNILVNYSDNAFTLSVLRTEDFSRSNLTFNTLNLNFIQSRSSALRVEGSVQARLFGKTVVLRAELNATALIFKYQRMLTDGDSPIAPLDTLGHLDLASLQVGTGNRTWDGLTAFYALPDISNNTIFDTAGTPSTNTASAPLDLVVKTPKLVSRTPNGIKISAGEFPEISSSGSGKKITDACKQSQAITIEAWVKPANVTQRGPARIVTLSKDTSNRNFTLGQDGNQYIVRLRRNQSANEATTQGMPPLTSISGAVTADLTHIVFTRDSGGSQQNDKARLYINGVNRRNPNESVDLSGSFQQWDESYKFALANELNVNNRDSDRTWQGEIYQVAIYNRALTQEEVERAYYPALKAQLVLPNVPAPFDAIEVEIYSVGDRTQLICRPTPPLVIPANQAADSALQLTPGSLIFEKSENRAWELSGSVQATLWGQTLGQLAASLPANAAGKPILTLRKPSSSTLALDGLGTLLLPQFELQSVAAATPTWAVQTGANTTLTTTLPTPLKGPLGVSVQLGSDHLQLQMTSTNPLPVVEFLTFQKVNLTFRRVQSRWQGQGTVVALVFGTPLPLIADAADVSAMKLGWSADTLTTLIASPGRLAITTFMLSAASASSWQVSSAGELEFPEFHKFTGKLILATVQAGETGSGTRLFFVTSDVAPILFPLVAGSTSRVLTIRATMGRFDVFNTQTTGGVVSAEGWVFATNSTLYFDRIARELTGVRFRGDRTQLRFSLAQSTTPIILNLPTLPPFNGQLKELGSLNVDVRDFSLVVGSQPTLSSALSAGLPAQLDHLLGPESVRPGQRFFAKTIALLLNLDHSQGLRLKVNSALLQGQRSKVEGTGSDARLVIQLNTLIEARLPLPELRYTDDGWLAEGQLEWTQLSIPLALAKTLLTSVGLSQLGEGLPQKLPVAALNGLTPTGTLDVSALMNWLKQSGKAPAAAFPEQEWRALLTALAQVPRLPSALTDYLQTTPSKTLTYRFHLALNGSVTMELGAIASIRFLALAVSPPGVLGVTLRHVAIASLFGGQVHTVEMDATVDYVDLIAYRERLSVPANAASQLPSTNQLHSQLTVHKVLSAVTYPATSSVVTPLFFQDLGYEFLGKQGLGFGVHWHLPKGEIDSVGMTDLLGAIAPFLINASAELNKDALSAISLPLEFQSNSSYGQLPLYVGGAPEKRLQARTYTSTESAYVVQGWNALRRKKLSGVIQHLALPQRIGEVSFTFGPMQCNGGWALLSNLEYSQGLQAGPELRQYLDNLSEPWRTQISALLQSNPIQRRSIVQSDAAIAFPVGIWQSGQEIDLNVWIELIQSLSQGFGAAFSIAGTFGQNGNLAFPNVIAIQASGQLLVDLKQPQPIQSQGESRLSILDYPIFSGDIQLEDDRFFLNGFLSLFPDWSPVKLSQLTRITISPSGAQLETPVEFSLAQFDLRNPHLTLRNGHLTLQGQWLGQAITLTGIQRDNQFILQGTVSFEMPFSLTLGPIYDPNSNTKLADQICVCQEPDCRQIMTVSLVVELSSSGFLARVSSRFQWQDDTFTLHDVEVPEFRLFAPPTTRHAILGAVVAELRANANTIFGLHFKHLSDYFFTSITGANNQSMPVIYYGKRSPFPKTITVDLPTIFTADTIVQEEGTDSTLIVGQKSEQARLKVRLTGDLDRDVARIEQAYSPFIKAIAYEETQFRVRAGAVSVIKRRLAEILPMRLNRVLAYHYGFEPTKGYIDLQEGMRLRVDYQNYQFVAANILTAESGFVGSGSVFYTVNSYLRLLNNNTTAYMLGFDAFLPRLPLQVTTSPSESGAGGVIDLQQPGYQQPYFRLFYPQQFSGSGGRAGAERVATLVGATSLKALDTATELYTSRNGVLPPSPQYASFYFRGRAAVIPEIAVFMQEQLLYVPVGTTVRQLVERFAGIPISNLPRPDAGQFQGIARPRRLVHEGNANTPTYKFLNFGDYPSFQGNQDVYDLPVLKGDRFYF